MARPAAKRMEKERMRPYHQNVSEHYSREISSVGGKASRYSWVWNASSFRQVLPSEVQEGVVLHDSPFAKGAGIFFVIGQLLQE